MQHSADLDRIEQEKILAACHAVKFVKNGMKVGLGTGSTAVHVTELLGKAVAGGLDIVAVPSSDRTAIQAKQAGIPLTTLEELKTLDIYIDGTDEFDPQLNLIKGGGGALLREKILAYNSDVVVIVCDSTKQKERLGGFRLPVEVIPFAAGSIQDHLAGMGLSPVLRMQGDSPYRTDENHWILDTDISAIDDLAALNASLLAIPGLVETGLFLDMADLVIVGQHGRSVTYGRVRPQAH